LNYGLLAVARWSRSKRAPFPLNNPLSACSYETKSK